MFEGVKYSKCTIMEILNTIVDPNEIYSQYLNNNDIYIECFERLSILKEFRMSINILRNHSKRILDNYKKYEQLFCIFTRNLQEYKNNGLINEFIFIFYDLLGDYKELFQKYLICRIISIFIAIENKFPDKTHAIVYLSVLLDLFNQAECFNNYLIVVYYMEKLDIINISQEEIEFLKKCALIKRENICKELLCGMRIVDIQKVFENTKRGNRVFLKDSNWEKLIEVKETDSSIPFDIDFISFLLKNDISFEIKNGALYLGEYCCTGLTGRIFSISKKYEIKKDLIIKHENFKEVDEKLVIKKEKKVEIPSIVVKYSDHFIKPRRVFKWFYSNINFNFEDEDLEERNAHKKKIWEEENALFEKRKSIFKEKKEIIFKLFEKLKTMIEEKEKNEREEKIKRLKEQEIKIKESNPWFRKPKEKSELNSQSSILFTNKMTSENEIKKIPTSYINKFNEKLNTSDTASKWVRNKKK